MKKPLIVSFSGGETSAYMAQWLWNNKRDEFDMVFVFANTGQENEETLQFVEKCSNHFGFPIVWVEAVPRVSLLGKVVEMCSSIFNLDWIGDRIGTTFRCVSFNTADRSGDVFEKVIQKYGIPNMATPHCTRELKQAPISAYARALASKRDSNFRRHYTAIGIRSDEIDRVNSKAKSKRIIYPLIEMKPMSKQKINFWWSQQPFRLNLKGYQGNCITCWKKADNKLWQIAKENEAAFNWASKMELRYGKYIPESRLTKILARGETPLLPVRFFRKNRSAQDIIAESKLHTKQVVDDTLDDNYLEELDLIGGESCEVFSECQDT